MLVLCGKSAAGKDTLCERFIEKNPDWSNIVIYTTRPMREGEIQDVNYHFLGRRAFEELEKSGFLICIHEFKGWKYGIPKGEIINSDHKITVLSPAGIRELQRLGVDVISVYMNVDDRIRVLRQIMRGDDLREIFRRYEHDDGQFTGIEKEVSYILNNNKIEDTIDEEVKILNEILETEYKRREEEKANDGN